MTKTKVSVGVILAGAVVALTYPFADALLHRDRNQGEVRALCNAISIGMTRSEVNRVWSKGPYPHLRLMTVGKDKCIASAPSEAGYKNWVLFIEFDGDRVAALRIRNGDRLVHHPGAAPPDRSSPR